MPVTTHLQFLTVKCTCAAALRIQTSAGFGSCTGRLTALRGIGTCPSGVQDDVLCGGGDGLGRSVSDLVRANMQVVDKATYQQALLGIVCET